MKLFIFLNLAFSSPLSKTFGEFPSVFSLWRWEVESMPPSNVVTIKSIQIWSIQTSGEQKREQVRSMTDGKASLELHSRGIIWVLSFSFHFKLNWRKTLYRSSLRNYTKTCLGCSLGSFRWKPQWLTKKKQKKKTSILLRILPVCYLPFWMLLSGRATWVSRSQH